MFYVLNDASIFNIKQGDGKDICNDSKIWDIRADELRISPKGDRVVFQTNDGKYFVAKLNKDYDG